MTALSMARRQELREDYPLWRRQLPVGYCECAGGAKRHPVGCKAGSHQPFTCADVCAPVRALPGRLSAFSVFHSCSPLY